MIHATMLQNRTISSAMNNLTPYKSFFEQLPDNSNLRISGRTSHLYKSNITRKPKQDDHVELGIYFGTIDGLHRIQIIGTGCVIHTKNVLFNENYFLAEKWVSWSRDDEAYGSLCEDQEVYGQRIIPTASIDGTSHSTSEESLMKESQDQLESTTIRKEGTEADHEHPQNAAVCQTGDSCYPHRERRSPLTFTINALTRSKGKDEINGRDAILRADAQEWKEAMQEEVTAIRSLGCWKITDRPEY